MKKGTLLTLALLAAGAYGLAENWDSFLEALGMGEVSPEALRAINIAKADYSLDRMRTNHEVIDGRVKNLEGPVDVVGWQAERKTRTLFLVTFLFTQNGVTDGFYFEVDVGSTQVRNARDDPALQKLYGVPPPQLLR